MQYGTTSTVIEMVLVHIRRLQLRREETGSNQAGAEEDGQLKKRGRIIFYLFRPICFE